jgi:hypothetical protein
MVLQYYRTILVRYHHAQDVHLYVVIVSGNAFAIDRAAQHMHDNSSDPLAG